MSTDIYSKTNCCRQDDQSKMGDVNDERAFKAFSNIMRIGVLQSKFVGLQSQGSPNKALDLIIRFIWIWSRQSPVVPTMGLDLVDPNTGMVVSVTNAILLIRAGQKIEIVEKVLDLEEANKMYRFIQNITGVIRFLLCTETTLTYAKEIVTGFVGRDWTNKAEFISHVEKSELEIRITIQKIQTCLQVFDNTWNTNLTADIREMFEDLTYESCLETVQEFVFPISGGGNTRTFSFMSHLPGLIQDIGPLFRSQSLANATRQVLVDFQVPSGQQGPSKVSSSGPVGIQVKPKESTGTGCTGASGPCTTDTTGLRTLADQMQSIHVASGLATPASVEKKQEEKKSDN